MRKIFVVLTLLASCHHVRQSDLDAWKGVSRAELQMHPVFSVLPKKVEAISNGDEWWTYSSCHVETGPVSCNKVGQSNLCTGGGAEEVCCHHQFLVQGERVASYRAIGKCSTDCSARPASRPCE